MFVKYAALFLIGLISFTNAHSLSKRTNYILTLDVNPHQGVEPTQVQAPDTITDYHFPVDSPILNITCTVTNPSHRFKLSITREQKFNNGESGTPVEILDPNEYALFSNLDQTKYNIEYSDIGASSFKIVLSIRSLKLEDNGIYTCKYNNIVKKINAIVYKPPTLSHITFPSGKNEKVNLNSSFSLGCKVTDVYPKPKIFFSHSTRNLNDSISEKDISNTKHNEYYAYSLMSSVNFTVDYKDHNKVINCTVQSTGSHEIQLSKSYQLQVFGTQIIDSSCSDNLVAKFGDEDFKISCQFFSNPKEDVEFLIHNNVQKQTTTESSGEPNSETEETTPIDPVTELSLKVEDDNEFHKVMVEQNENGLYTAVLKFTKVRDEDIRNYTLKIGSVTRVFRIVANENELSKSLSSEQQETSKSFKIHSNTSVLLLIINVLFYLKFLSR